MSEAYEKCDKLEDVVMPYAVYGSEYKDDYIFNIIGLVDGTPQETIAAYVVWDNIARPRDKDGNRIML